MSDWFLFFLLLLPGQAETGRSRVTLCVCRRKKAVEVGLGGARCLERVFPSHRCNEASRPDGIASIRFAAFVGSLASGLSLCSSSVCLRGGLLCLLSSSLSRFRFFPPSFFYLHGLGPRRPPAGYVHNSSAPQAGGPRARVSLQGLRRHIDVWVAGPV